MGRKLLFRHVLDEFTGELDKLNRDELYPWSEIEAFDDEGHRCELVSVADDGKTLFGSGGYAFANLNDDGDFVESGEMIAVNSENLPFEIYDSSFTSGIDLEETATVEQFLSHQVKSVHKIALEDVPEKIIKDLKNGTILAGDFSYSKGIVRDKCFLLANLEGVPFFFMTVPSEIDYLTFKDVAPVTEEDDDGAVDDLFDFGSL